MANNQTGISRPQLKSGPLITGAALVAGGALLALAGFAVGGSHLIAATRRWVSEMDVPPNELAKLQWAKAQAAAAAGAAAWQNGTGIIAEPSVS